MGTRVAILREVKKELSGGDILCFQQCVYDYGDNNSDLAFRFIRRDTNSKLKAQRGQAGIPELDIAIDLINEMKKIMIKQME